jgi:hypothetical protein
MDATKPAKRPSWTQMVKPEDYPDAESWYAAERLRLRTLAATLREKARHEIEAIHAANERGEG